MSDSGKAVFLSYASQDAEAAKRICDALRSSGVEVWFDAEGGLEHGDEWDAKIRRQIKDCVLFLPVISANTEAREEGYFRIEWELAAQRALGIASGVAFILPIVIDDTKEPDALVPDRFRTVQWTRLRGGELTPEVKARFLKLWSHRAGVVKHQSGEAEVGGRRSEDRTENREPKTVNVPRPGWKAYAGLAAGIVVLMTAVGWWLLRSSPPSSDLRPAVSSSNPPPISVPSPPSSGAAPGAPLSPARQLAAKSAALHDQLGNASRSDLELAEQYCQQALALDQNDSEVWAEYSLVSSNYIAIGYDRSNERLQSARAHAERAVKLAPDSREAQFALATAYRWQGATQDEAIRRLRGLVDRMPDDRRVLRALGNALRMAGQNEEALLWYTRAAALPGGDPLALFQRAMALEALGRNPEAAASLDESLALHPSASAYVLKVFYLVRWGELEAARAALDKVPAPFLVEERGALAAGMVYLRQRQWDRCLAALLALPHDYVEDAYFRGPKGLLTGNARFHAGRKLAAEQDWRAALLLVNQRLAGTRETTLLHLRKAELHARLQEADEADRALRTFEELQGGGGFLARARIEVWLNRPAAAIESLQAFKMTREVRVLLRQEPEWDPLRGDPRFQALLAEPPAAAAVPPDPKSKTPDPSNPAPPDAKSIAVLPFSSLSADKDNEFFAEGVHDDVITNLAKIRDLKVISRTSVLTYRKTEDRNLRKIAAELGVATVLEGSVRRAGNKVRMNAQLIDARTDAHLWAENFEGDASDIFALQAELAQKIAAQLKATLTADEKSLIERRPTSNPAAYEHYLRARVLEERLTQSSRIESYNEAIAAYEQAVALDPAFVFAHTRMARLHGTMYWFGYLDPSPTRKARVDAAVAAAERHAPGAPETHYARGLREYFVNNDWERALAEYRQAEAGLPNDSQLQALIAFSHRRLGRWMEAVAHMERSLALGPRDLYIASQIGAYYRALRRYDQAIAAAERCVELFPQDNFARSILELARFDRDNDLPAYLQALAKVPAPDNDPFGLGAAYQRAFFANDLAAADQALADPRQTGITDQWVAIIAEPVALHRARVAWLRGDAAAAKRFAEEAITEFNRRAWTPRQRPYVALAVCEANAYVGRTDEVLRAIPTVLADARRADVYSSRLGLEYIGQAYLVLGRREEAFTMLRGMVSGPSYRTPNILRIDPFWSRLKDDPRFEEILQSAKPL